jgi:hypothetical protein
MDINKLPGWSAMVIVPVVIIGASARVILRSSNPVPIAAIVVASSVVVGALGWGVLSLLGRNQK